MPARPNNIRHRGLKAHLDENTDLGYKVFAEAVDKGVNTANLQRLYGRSRQTIEKWLEIYREERATIKP